MQSKFLLVPLAQSSQITHVYRIIIWDRERRFTPHLRWPHLLAKQTYSSPSLLATRRSSATSTPEIMSSPNHNLAIRDDRILMMIPKPIATLPCPCHHVICTLAQPK